MLTASIKKRTPSMANKAMIWTRGDEAVAQGAAQRGRKGEEIKFRGSMNRLR